MLWDLGFRHQSGVNRASLPFEAECLLSARLPHRLGNGGQVFGAKQTKIDICMHVAMTHTASHAEVFSCKPLHFLGSKVEGVCVRSG